MFVFPAPYVAGVAIPTRVYLDRGENEDNLTTYTFSSFPFGTASASRRIVVGVIGSNGSNNRTISTITVGGVSASIVVQHNNSGRRAGLAIADVPTGTSGDIVVTFDAGEDRCVIWAWAAYDLASATAVDTGQSTTAPLDVSLNTSADGLAFACAFSSANSSATWVGLTEDNDAAFATQGFSSASLEGAAASTPLTVTCTWSSSSQPVGVSASFL